MIITKSTNVLTDTNSVVVTVNSTTGGNVEITSATTPLQGFTTQIEDNVITITHDTFSVEDYLCI
ncbi:MAG: hypothetical protein MJ200_04240 [Mycoplasmoidaceae bacterium]|nr:hypothetical protein [Mycoplasmoidaceae bacterium]